jgi:hypothetical protein
LTCLLGLVAGDDDGIDNVLDGASPAQVVDWQSQTLHDWADSDAPSGLLHSLVRIVSSVEIWRAKGEKTIWLRWANHAEGLYDWNRTGESGLKLQWARVSHLNPKP